MLTIQRNATDPGNFDQFLRYLAIAFPKTKVPDIPNQARILKTGSYSLLQKYIEKYKEPAFRAHCIEAWIKALKSSP